MEVAMRPDRSSSRGTQYDRLKPRVRLTHPELDLWVDVDLRQREGLWVAVADLAGEPDTGTGARPQDAARRALAALGSRRAREMTATVGLGSQTGMEAP